MKQPQTRPARPDLLSPVPFTVLHTSRRRLIFNALLALSVLAGAAALLLLWTAQPDDWLKLALWLFCLALTIGALAEIGESWYLWPATPRPSASAVSFVAYQSPIKLWRDGLLALTVLAPCLGGLYYSLNSLLTVDEQLMRQFFALLFGLKALLYLANLPGRWRQRHLQQRAHEPAAHTLPARGPRRPVFLTAGGWRNLAAVLLVLAFLLHAYIYMVRTGRWSSPIFLIIAVMTLLDSPLAATRRWRYRADGDAFVLYRRRWPWGWREVARWPAADFLGFYVIQEKQDSAAQLWLAGRAGGEGLMLGTASYALQNNANAGRDAAEGLSRDSGLPVLYRWPAPPRELFGNK